MQFKQALIGALLGGVIGVGVLVAAFYLFSVQHTALALVVAVLVGSGVRMMVSTKGHASYVRGGLTALIAVAAYVGGTLVVVQVARSQIAANAARPAQAAPIAEADDSAEQVLEGDQEAAIAEVEVQESRDAGRFGAPLRTPVKPSFSTWDFIWLSVAALVAYELGRGTGAMTPGAPESDAPAAPATPA